jgi:uncharacterized membrane protein
MAGRRRPIPDLAHLHAPFGTDAFGRRAEWLARSLGSPRCVAAQTLVIAVWIVLNAARVVHFDLYPFILLNLAFSTQAALAAPLILLAEARQADRDRMGLQMHEEHRDELAGELRRILLENARLTREVRELAAQLLEPNRDGDRATTGPGRPRRSPA